MKDCSQEQKNQLREEFKNMRARMTEAARPFEGHQGAQYAGAIEAGYPPAQAAAIAHADDPPYKEKKGKKKK